MATCFSVVRGKRVRVTELDDCGVPLYETGHYVVSQGYIQVALTSVLEAGDEFVQKNADGKLCINERAPDNLKRLNVTVDWCQVDPDIIDLITGYPVELDDTESVGFRIQEGLADKKWGMEVWTGLGGNQCGPAGVLYGYLLLPFGTGSTMGDLTIANASTTFQTTGYTEGNSGWGAGPWDVLGDPQSPTPLLDPIGPVDHALIRVTPVPPPAVVCGAQDMPPAPSSPTSP